MRNQFDQYNRPIPQDLILLLLLPAELDPVKLKSIDDLEWYCFEGNKTNHIFVSQSKLEEVLGELTDSEIGPDDFESLKLNLVKIDSVLHRWTNEDGFYWA